MSSVGKFSRSSFLGDRTQIQKEREKFVAACLRPLQNVQLGIFTSQSCSDNKEMYKKAVLVAVAVVDVVA